MQMLVDKYAQKTALRLGVAPEAVRAEFRKVSRSKGATPVATAETDEGTEKAAPVEMTRPSVTEFWLLKLLLLHDDTADWIHAHLDVNWVQHPQVREVAAFAANGSVPTIHGRASPLSSRNAKPKECTT